MSRALTLAREWSDDFNAASDASPSDVQEVARALLVASQREDELRRATYVPTSREVLLAIGLAEAAVEMDREMDYPEEKLKDVLMNPDAYHDEKERRRAASFFDGVEFRFHMAVRAYLSARVAGTSAD